jgi:PBSX family phage portal protein
MPDHATGIEAHILGTEPDADALAKALMGAARPASVARGRSQQLSEAAWEREYEAGNVRRPPYDLDALAALYESNATHKACVDAKVTNIVGLGYRFVEAEDATGQPDAHERSADEDLARLTQLFSSCNPDMTFADVMRCVWTDVESTGNGYVEVTRNVRGDIDGLYHIPGTTMRVKADRSGFVQIREGKTRHFKTLGDPEPRRDPDTGALQNEVVHFLKYTPQSSFYGIPDIIAALPAAVGDKAAREYNIDFFEHNAIPRMAIIVEGGRLSDELLNAIKTYMESEIKGQAHKTLVLDVPGHDVKIRLEPLGMMKTEDAAFLQYRRANRDEILMVHRVPPSKITIVENANLANSRDQDKTFREQVVRPEQRRIEFVFNQLIREQMAIATWRFRFVEMDLGEERDAAEVAKLYADMGAWTVGEIRAKQGLPPLTPPAQDRRLR